MRLVLRIGGSLGVRHVPRQSGGCRSSRGLSVPGFCGRRRRWDGPRGTVAGDGDRRRLGTAVLRLVMNFNAAGRFTPPQQRFVAPNSAFLPGAPKAPLGGVQPHRTSGAAKRRCRRPADKSRGAPSRGTRRAVASSRDALRLRRASVVTTAKLGSDDAARRRIHNPETRVVRGFSQPGTEGPKSAGKCQRAKTQVFSRSANRQTPMFDLGCKAESDALLAGHGTCIVSGNVATLRLL